MRRRRGRVDRPRVDRRRAVHVALRVERPDLEGVRPLGEVAELLRRGARTEVAAVEAALELGPGLRRGELEAGAVGARERRRRHLDLGVGRVHVGVALGGANRQRPAEQRAGVVLEAVAHAQLPGALLLLAVEARELVALRAEVAGVRGRARAGADRCGGLVVEDRVGQVVAAVVGPADVLDQAHGRGVVRARQLDLEVAHERVLDAADAHVEVLDPSADRHEQGGDHPAGVVVGDRERLGARVRGGRAGASRRNRDRHRLGPALDASHSEHPGRVDAARGGAAEAALEGRRVLLLGVGRDVGVGRARLADAERAAARKRGGDAGGDVRSRVTDALTERERLPGLEEAVTVLPVHRVVDRHGALHEHRRRDLLLRVRDHEREILVERLAVAGHAVAAERLRDHLHRHPAARACGEHHVLHVVAEVGLATRDRDASREPVAPVGAPAHAHLKVEVVHEGVPGDGGGRRVGPGERHADRLRRVGHLVGAQDALPVGVERVGRGLVEVLPLGRVERGADIHPSPALIGVRSAGNRAVLAAVSPGDVRGAVHQDRLGERRRGGLRIHLAHIPVTDQRGGAGHVRGRLRGARHERVEAAAAEVLVADRGAGVAGVLRRGARYVRPGRHQVRLQPAVLGRAAAREVDDIRGAVRATVRDAAAVRARAAHALGGAHRDHVLRGARRGDAAVALVALRVERVALAVAVVAGREDLDHLLVAGRADRGVAHQRVVCLRGGVVAAEVRDAPGVVRDARAAGIGVGCEGRVVHRRRCPVAAEDLRGANLGVGRHAEPVPVARRVLPDGGAEARRDRRDVGPVAAAVRGVRVGGVVVGVADATEQVRVDVDGIASVEARVRHVDGESEGGSKALRSEPRLVSRTARRVAGEIAGNDLGAPLVMQLRHAGRLDGNHGGVCGEGAHLVRAQVEELRAHLGHNKVGGELAPRVLRITAGILTRGARDGLDRHATAGRTVLDLVGRTQRGGRAHRRVGPDQLGHAVERCSLGMDDVPVLRGVAEDGRAAGLQLRQPLALHRPYELDEHERLTAVGRVLVSQRGPRRGSTSPPASSTSCMSSRRLAPAARRRSSSSPLASTSENSS